MHGPIVVHNGVSPTRFFLYLFPEEPHFNEEEVGEPAFLTPLLEAGKLEEAREASKVLVLLPQLSLAFVNSRRYFL